MPCAKNKAHVRFSQDVKVPARAFVSSKEIVHATEVGSFWKRRDSTSGDARSVEEHAPNDGQSREAPLDEKESRLNFCFGHPRHSVSRFRSSLRACPSTLLTSALVALRRPPKLPPPWFTRTARLPSSPSSPSPFSFSGDWGPTTTTEALKNSQQSMPVAVQGCKWGQAFKQAENNVPKQNQIGGKTGAAVQHLLYFRNSNVSRLNSP